MIRAGVVYAASTGSYGPELGVISSIAASTIIAMIPEAAPLGRRLIYRLEDVVERYYSTESLRGFTVLSILDSPSRYRGLEYIWSRWGYSERSPAVLAVSSSLLTASAELVLTPAPSVLSSNLGSRGLAQYLVYSSIFMGSVLIAAKPFPGIIASGWLWDLAAVLVPSLVAIGLIGMGSLLAIYVIALFMVAYNVLETGNYNAYSQATSGYELGKYQAIREVGGLIGGLASGYTALYLGYTWSLYIGAVAAAIAILMKRVA